MKKLTTILLAGVATLAFTACGGGGSSSSGTNPPPVENPTPPPTEPEPTPPVTSSPFDEVQEVYDGDQISVGTFIGNGLNYYDLHMPSHGNLIMDGDSVIYLYDMNLNIIDSGPRDIELEAGEYSIKFNHYDSKFTFTLNSNVLYNQNNLPLIEEAGTYSGTGLQYYRINMPSNGNLVIDAESYLSLYDMNLNFINGYASETIALDAGEYIIKFNHYDNKFTFTLNSNVW